MKITKRIKALVGFDEARQAPPPAYHTITDGLLITATKAEAWYDLATANLDTATTDEKLDNLDAVMTAVGKALGDRHCHLKLMWGRYDGRAYYEDVQNLYDGGLGEGRKWAQMWAERIDALGLPERHLMLGVTIELRGGAAAASVKRTANAAVGENPDRLSDKELADYQIIARRIMKALGSCPLRARQATAEKIAWMIGRETARVKQTVPRDGQIKGARLSHLLSSKAVPYADHLEILTESGEVGMYTAVLPIIDFPDEYEIPGEAEWLRTLSTITKLAETGTDEAGEPIFEEVPVFADASIRFQGVPRRAALKMADEARRTAKEQRRSAAKHSAGEVSTEVEDAETDNEQLKVDIKRNGTSLVVHHPRLIVTATSKEDLEDNAQALINHYADLGITVTRGEDEQRDFWLELLPGDALRVSDLGQTVTDVAFWGSFFWAGSKVGDAHGGISGMTTGTTASLFRSNVLGAADRGDTTTTLYGGRSGRGKSTAMMIELLSAIQEGPEPAWATLVDAKGDLGGLISVCETLGIPNGLVQIDEKNSGAADMFRAVEPAAAPAAVQRQLALMAMDADHVAIAASSTLRYATEEAKESDTPSTYGVIQRMMRDEEKPVASFGRYLNDLAEDPLGKIVLGPPTGETFLTDQAGLWLLQVPRLSLPDAHSMQSDWDAYNRLSMAVLQGITTYALAISSSKPLRSRRKGVAIPECHLFLNAHGGAGFLDQIARMGRAFNTSLILDTQDCTSIAEVPGLVEQLQGVRIFQLTSEQQQDAASKLLGLKPDASTRRMIHGLARIEGADVLRKGHALVRDWLENVATVQFDYPSPEVAEAMSTDPNAKSNRYVEDPEDAESLTTQEVMA